MPTKMPSCRNDIRYQPSDQDPKIVAYEGQTRLPLIESMVILEHERESLKLSQPDAVRRYSGT